MGVDSRSQLTTAKKKEEEGRTVRLAQLSYLQSVCWKGCISPKDQAFNPHLDDTEKMRDWWPKVQDMTGRTTHLRLPVIEQIQIWKQKIKVFVNTRLEGLSEQIFSLRPPLMETYL